MLSNKNWILIQYMREYYIWWSLWINLRTLIVQHIFMRFIFGTWTLLLRKLCRWHQSLYCCKQYSRSTRETHKHHAEALYLVCQQRQNMKMSPFAEHTRGCYHPNIKYDNKLFKIKKVVRYSVWEQTEVWQVRWEYLSKKQIAN